MKKIFSIFVLLTLLLSGNTVCGQSVSKQLKNSQKALEAEIKSLQKDGWKSMNTGSIASAVAEHMEKKKSNPYFDETTHISKACITLNMGKAETRNSAINEYVELCGGMVRGRVLSELQDVNEAQADNVVEKYERLLEKEFGKVIYNSYFLHKEVGGKFIVRGTFIIDEEKAQRVAKKALEEALEDAGIMRNYANEISGFIDDGFKK